jgi:putative phosphoesterase
MRAGVLSDVHANLAGLEAALAAMGALDRLLFAGDLLGYYFDGPAVVHRLRDLGAVCVLGNHDVHLLAHLGLREEPAAPAATPAAYRARYGPGLDRAAAELSPEDLSWLAGLPTSRRLRLDAVEVLLVHGSPWRPVDEYVYPDQLDFERFRGVGADLVVMGHTHRPLLRRDGAVTLLNPGSCGQPRDGDPRASFAVLEIEGAELAVRHGRADWDRAPLLARCAALAPEAPLLRDLLTR